MDFTGNADRAILTFVFRRHTTIQQHIIGQVGFFLIDSKYERVVKNKICFF
jgi:hypothetical protein